MCPGHGARPWLCGKKRNHPTGGSLRSRHRRRHPLSGRARCGPSSTRQPGPQQSNAASPVCVSPHVTSTSFLWSPSRPGWPSPPPWGPGMLSSAEDAQSLLLPDQVQRLLTCLFLICLCHLLCCPLVYSVTYSLTFLSLLCHKMI
ncbi:hypothetical protein HJG60_011158 [Phyllostomus discolor]|uniref:Uncharacterized protein n=1 Tax=Phyllostomus discolor TaxID=89673 RepID=A0A834E518_9CHIR|nr:hypothetical protein HJG60_011158 [Phyllostomus discolor]